MNDHTEAVQVTFNEDEISMHGLLDVYFKHATGCNNNSSETRYDSVIWYHDHQQEQMIIAALEKRKRRSVDVKPATSFHTSWTLASICIKVMTPFLRWSEKHFA
jgi:peptide methionine sulfoxide reductase MsrA